MASIEPDLAPPRVDQLEALYANETPADHDARMKRYGEAFAAYDQKIEVFLGELKKSAREERVHAETQSRAQDETQEEQLLSQIASF